MIKYSPKETLYTLINSKKTNFKKSPKRYYGIHEKGGNPNI